MQLSMSKTIKRKCQINEQYLSGNLCHNNFSRKGHKAVPPLMGVCVSQFGLLKIPEMFKDPILFLKT